MIMTAPPRTRARRSGDPQRFDLLLSGGGLVGLTLGVALADAGLAVAVIDREDPAEVLGAPFDGRASAIARGSQQVLAAIGMWPHVGTEAAPILDIRVSDGQVGRRPSRLFLHYDSAELGEGPMGHIVENRVLRRALQARAAELPGLTLLAPANLETAERREAAVTARLADGRELQAPLVVAAEGRSSPLRESAGIAVTAWDYPQVGIVATLYHEHDHAGTAHEHFLPSGPFAVLPLTDDAQGRHRSSLVWTEKRALAASIMKLDDQAFAAEIQRRFGDGLGEIRVEDGRWSYPLSLMHATRYHDRRLVLVGDADHLPAVWPGAVLRDVIASGLAAVTHLTHIVEDLLDTTRIAQGKMRLQRQSVELGDLVRRTMEDHRSCLEESGIVLQAQLGSEPLWVNADATRLIQDGQRIRVHGTDGYVEILP